METKKAIGTRGSWFASVDGEMLPCVHEYWWVAGARYNDKGLQDTPKGVELVAAIREKKRVILTSGKPEIDEFDRVISFERTGYIAIYAVDSIEFDGDGLRFKFVKRLEELE